MCTSSLERLAALPAAAHGGAASSRDRFLVRISEREREREREREKEKEKEKEKERERRERERERGIAGDEDDSVASTSLGLFS